MKDRTINGITKYVKCKDGKFRPSTHELSNLNLVLLNELPILTEKVETKKAKPASKKV